MGIFNRRSQFIDSSDTSLVLASLGGNRDAFGVIVTRYQSLLCSLAYSAVGDIKLSEDIAQEAFVEAWQKLDTLLDPEKLKAWLCGILRFKVSRHRRKEANQPARHAEQLDDQVGNAPQHPDMEGSAIREQEQALLWQTLEQLPQTYREPLILYYREQRSIEHVAAELELSEDTVKQRLSRGRKVLQQAMVSFVEGALEKSKPGTMFTAAVLSAISGISPPAKAAALGTGAFKAGTFFSWAGLISIIASFSGVIGSLFSLRASLDQSRTRRERRTAVILVTLFFAIAIVFVAGMFGLRYLAQQDSGNLIFFTAASQALVLAFALSYIALMITMLKRLPAMRAQERKLHPEAFTGEMDNPASKRREYRSAFTLLGVPLVHFKLGMPEAGDKPAYGWIAGGDRAYGLLFAWGAWAVAPVSVGIVSFGIVSVGAIGLGLLATGTVAIGLISFGASAVGYKAYAAMSAVGWNSAFSNGFSVAREAALGPFAFAKEVNNQLAAEQVDLAALNQTYLWVLVAIAVLVLVPAIWHSSQVRKRMRINSP